LSVLPTNSFTRDFMKLTATTPRPSFLVLAVTYAVWLSVITAILTVPSLSILGVLAGVMVLFVWLPFWAYQNWDIVVSDPPSTYATIVVAAILVLLLGLMFRYDLQSVAYRLVQSGWLQPKDMLHVNWVEYGLHMTIYFSIYPIWQRLRRVLGSSAQSTNTRQ
jgi:hypothetical protein